MGASATVLERMTLKPKDPAAVGDVTELLQRLVRAYGSNAVAEILGVDKAMITHWTRKTNPKPISAIMASRIIDIHDVINRALQIFQPQVAADWLAGSEPLLDGARPIDVLKNRGAIAVIQALEGIAAGVYA
jgi:uncharacterized protein (DUF2384 family)